MKPERLIKKYWYAIPIIGVGGYMLIDRLPPKTRLWLGWLTTQRKIPFEAMYNQAKLETGNFTSQLYKDCHNLFGMTDYYTSPCGHTQPKIEEGKKAGMKYAGFRSDRDCMIQYQKKIATEGNHFYPCLHLAQGKNYTAYWECLQKKGWATDPHYAQKIISLADKAYG